MAEIDLELLNDIFGDLLKKCGVDPGERKRITHEDILSDGEYAIGGNYQPETQKITIHFLGFENFAVSKDARRLMLLKILAHEMGHAMSAFVPLNETKKKYRLGIGYQGEFPWLRGMDEAFTEIIARDVVREYVKRSGIMSEGDIERLSEKLPESEAGVAEKISDFLEHLIGRRIVPRKDIRLNLYEEELALIDTFVEYFQKEAGVSKETVIQAFVREKVSRDARPIEEWREIFCEILGKERGAEIEAALVRMHWIIPETKRELERTLNGTPKKEGKRKFLQ